MRHPSLYLDWYVHVPKVKYDFRSSGLSGFTYDLDLGEVDLSANYAHGNPAATELVAKRYGVKPENVFISSDGATGQFSRVIRHLAERSPGRSEAVVEYPTYEPLLRQVEEHFKTVKRLEREEAENFGLNADSLRKLVSEKTALIVLTNAHAPSGAVSDAAELKEIANVAAEHGVFVLADEIYAEFNRDEIPTVLSVEPELGVVTTSFTKAYGLGGLRAGITLASKEIVDELYLDSLNTVGTSSNLIDMVTVKLLGEGKTALEQHKQKWMKLRKETEQLLSEKSLEYFPNKTGVTYWVKLPIEDTHKWTDEQAIPRFSLAPVPGTFFLFRNDTELVRSNRVRLGLGNVNPDVSNLTEAFDWLEKALTARA